MNAKKKGNRGENLFANWLTEQGIKSYRNSSSGANIQKSDVHNSINANFEVKTVKRINLMQAWKQTQRDAEMSRSTPYLVIHLDGMPEETWLMVMNNWDWIEFVKAYRNSENSQNSVPRDRVEAKNDSQSVRELKWAVEALKVASAKVMKLL